MESIDTAAASGKRPLAFTWFERNDAPSGTKGEITPAALADWIESQPPHAATKDGLPLIKLATFTGDYRADANLVSVHGIEADYDGGLMPPDIAAWQLEQAGIAAIIYTSPSHQPKAPRWRILCPLSLPVQPTARHDLVSRLNGALGGTLARESWTAAQAFYLGAVDGGEPVKVWRVDGLPIDLATGITPIGPKQASGTRAPLGTLPTVAIKHVRAALDEIDPNELDYTGWRDVTAAYRGASGDREHWDAWCARYERNNHTDNAKCWRSFDRGTSLGWSYLASKAPIAAAAAAFGTPAPVATYGEILTPQECSQWFAGCTLIGPANRIIDAKGIEYDPGAFNSTFGGKRFVITGTGKSTDEAWKAATRSTLWRVPKVDGTAFRTDQSTGHVSSDELGRTAVNVYIPARIETLEGDPGPFLQHMEALIPDDNDRRILMEYLAHNVRFPGHKIPWAPVIQSVEGVGKNVIKHTMTHAMGNHYTYEPNTHELCNGGSKFNAWMERKLFLIADEIKVDDKRDLIDLLKPMISEETLEIQGKGKDQRKADNPSNWLFFTNYKDAVPIHKNGRRYAIFYSPIQSLDDLLARGMNDAYFDILYDDWLGTKTHRDGLRIVAHYLLSYPIERGAIPKRAPRTTSWSDALIEGRGWLECMIADAIEDGRNGFKGGWINTAAVTAFLRENGKNAQSRTIGDAIRELGYHDRGQAGRGWFQDDPRNPDRRGSLWCVNPGADKAAYPLAQGYDDA